MMMRDYNRSIHTESVKFFKFYTLELKFAYIFNI
jgi:hypothetical protein